MSPLHYKAICLLKTFSLPRTVCIVKLYGCVDPAQDNLVKEQSHGMARSTISHNYLLCLGVNVSLH